MALFAVNTGCRDGEICKLRWEWELKLQSMNTSVFIIPGSFVKNGDERGGITAGAGARFEAHIRTTLARGGCEL